MAVHETHLQMHLGSSGRGDDAAALDGSARHGFLQQDVFACPCGGNGDLLMGFVRCGDHHRVDVVAREQRLPVGGACRNAVISRQGRSPFWRAPGDHAQVGAAGRSKAIEVVGRDETGTDHANPYRSAGGQHLTLLAVRFRPALQGGVYRPAALP